MLVAEIQGANANTSGSAVGGLIGGRFGGLMAGIRTREMEANTILSLTNVRTTETIATEDGYAAKNNLSFAGGGGLGFFGGAAAAVGGGYDNTDLGRIVTLSFIQAYLKMVTSLNWWRRVRRARPKLRRPAPSARSAPVALHRAALRAVRRSGYCLPARSSTPGKERRIVVGGRRRE